MEHFDAIIIGFGKGGKLLAADLANRGQQVAIIERSAAMYGGSCINIACIPTKALIHQAQMIKELNLASFEEKAAAYRKAIIKKNEITTALRKLNFDRLNDHPNITVYTGVASFRSSRKIEVTTETDRLEIEGKRIFIDTGALPVIPPISGIRESRGYIPVPHSWNWTCYRKPWSSSEEDTSGWNSLLCLRLSEVR